MSLCCDNSAICFPKKSGIRTHLLNLKGYHSSQVWKHWQVCTPDLALVRIGDPQISRKASEMLHVCPQFPISTGRESINYFPLVNTANHSRDHLIITSIVGIDLFTSRKFIKFAMTPRPFKWVNPGKSSSHGSWQLHRDPVAIPKRNLYSEKGVTARSKGKTSLAISSHSGYGSVASKHGMCGGPHCLERQRSWYVLFGGHIFDSGSSISKEELTVTHP